MSVEPIAELAASLDDVRSLDPQLVSAGDLLVTLAELERVRRKVDAELVRWLGVADEREVTVEQAGRATRSWLIEEQNLAPSDASRRVQLARSLPLHPRLQDAFRAAEISIDHAAVILAALLDAPAEYREAMEEALLGVARVQPPYVVAQAVNAIREQLGIERTSEQRRMRQDAQRHVNVSKTFGGSRDVKANLKPLTGEAFEKALDAALAGKVAGPEDKRTAAQRRHDAFEEIVNHYLAHADLPASNGERPRVIVTIPLDALLDKLSTTWGLLSSGVEISPETARRLACDGDLIPAVLGSRSEVLDIGRATSVWTIAQRRAVELRDGHGCAFPRCTRPPADLHHIVWWSYGGKTSIDNAAWLCAFHHWLVHEGRWTIARRDNGSYLWTSPNGRAVSGEPPPRHPQAA